MYTILTTIQKYNCFFLTYQMYFAPGCHAKESSRSVSSYLYSICLDYLYCSKDQRKEVGVGPKKRNFASQSASHFPIRLQLLLNISFIIW